MKRIDLDGKVTGVYADYHYVGTGDIGGAVSEESVKLLEATVTKGMASLPTFGGRGGRGARPDRSAGAAAESARSDGRRAGSRGDFRAADQMFKRHQARYDRRGCRNTRAIWN